MQILIVDDSRIMRNIVKKTLLTLNFEADNFFEAADGEEAFEILEKNSISLLLLDWNMPNLNGLQLVLRLRALPRYQDLPIIMVTSEAAKYNIVEAVKAGVNDYLVKPVNEKNLEEKLRSALQRNHA
ncbi:MAG: response regulator [Spirochaetales bacterium]|nr:response regulator [Spirochaetales bacterium]